MRIHTISLSLGVVFLTLGLSGCPAEGVGDPCEPERVPDNGFVATEAYLETSSVQCRTRICMVYKLEGDTRKIGCNEDGCISPVDFEERVYCTCRCNGPDESKATFCECPGGYSCTEVLTSEASGVGIRGSYCVKKSSLETEEAEAAAQ